MKSEKVTRAGVRWRRTCKKFGGRKVCFWEPMSATAKPKGGKRRKANEARSPQPARKPPAKKARKARASKRAKRAEQLDLLG
jgi:hypothetical protein